MTQATESQSREPHLIGDYLTPEYLAQQWDLPLEYVTEKLAQNTDKEAA